MNDIILVCGLGRCGTSLVMQMLGAGGMPVTGPWPSFEDRAAVAALGDVDLAPFGGDLAVKVLDPHRHRLPSTGVRSIWLDRSPREQARSQVKLLSATEPMVATRRETIRAFEASIKKDRLKGLRAVSRGGAVLRLAFEDIIRWPWDAAIEIRDFVGKPLYVDSMADAVRPRPTWCAPDIDLEMTLMREGASA